MPAGHLKLHLYILLILLFSSVLHASAEEKISVRIGAYDNPPKIRINEGGKLSGFWPELISYIAEKENWNVQYVKGKWTEGLFNLAENRIDIMPDVAFTKERARLYAFSGTTILASWSRVYVRSDDNSIQSLEDLKGKRIAGLSGSANIEGPDGIKRLVQSFNLKCSVVEMESYKDVFQALEDKFADAVITNRNFGDEYSKTHPVKSTAIMLSPVSITFAFPKDGRLTPYLISRIDYQMNSLMNDNSSIYYQLLTKYFETEIAEKKVKELPSWFSKFILSVAVAALFLIALILFSRHQVRQKTRELVRFSGELQDRIEEESTKRLKNEQIIFEQKKFADMGHMIGAISHQWRQPLNSIFLISQWLQDEFEKKSEYSKTHAESFEKMTALIQQMSQTIDDFRNFFQPEKKKTVFDVTQAVLNCLRLISPELLHKKISLSFICRCGDKVCEMREGITLPACGNFIMQAEGFEGEFKQIVLNILGNSRDALADKNSPVKNISVEICSDDRFVYVMITDNGGGIPPEIISKVFDPYFTTKQEGKGIGIGLYMSKTILNTHMGSDIKLENTTDGTMTTITIPRATG